MFNRLFSIFESSSARLLAIAFIVLVGFAAIFFFASSWTFARHYPPLQVVFKEQDADMVASSKTPIVPHIFGDSSRPISEIELKVFYFVPKDRSPNSEALSAIEAALGSLKKFHESQFPGFSAISFSVFREPVIGLKPSDFYEVSSGASSLSAQERAGESMKQIREELSARQILTEGRSSQDAFPVTVIIYEGVGAGADLSRMIVAREFLTDPKIFYGKTVFTHEFYHTLGIPDGYDKEGSFSQDIMGAGRYRPLEMTYLAEETLKAMGL